VGISLSLLRDTDNVDRDAGARIILLG